MSDIKSYQLSMGKNELVLLRFWQEETLPPGSSGKVNTEHGRIDKIATG